MTYINKINPNKNMQKYIYNGVIITFLILFLYFIFFNNLSIFAVTNYLFESDLGRISLLVVLIAVASCNLFFGVLLLGIFVFLYEYQHQQQSNISKYNNMIENMSGMVETQTNKKNVTIQDILTLENNISSKQSNNSINFENGFNTNNSSIMQINPSFEGTFNNNYAPFLQ